MPNSIETTGRISRRRFLGVTGSGILAGCRGTERPGEAVPAFLQGYEDLYRQDARRAVVQWFRESGFGLSVHYGVYSQLGRGEDVQFNERIPSEEYEKLRDSFDPSGFRADEIADLAAAAGMKYVNLTVRHHDSFCLFRTNETDFTSLDSPSRRDLLGEMTESCDRKGLGLFVSYSYALDWRHPYFFHSEAAGLGWDRARPPSEQGTASLYKTEEDFTHYLNFVHAQLEEIFYRYRPLAGVWLHPVMGYFSRPDLFPVWLTYEIVRTANPAALIGFEEGASGDEDFVATVRMPSGPNPRAGEAAEQAWQQNREKPIEIRHSLQPGAWGYDRQVDHQHRGTDDVLALLERTSRAGANLLLNTALLPDGSIHHADIETLRAVEAKL